MKRTNLKSVPFSLDCMNGQQKSSSASRAIRCVAFTTLHTRILCNRCRTLLYIREGKCRSPFCRERIVSQWIVGELAFEGDPRFCFTINNSNILTL